MELAFDTETFRIGPKCLAPKMVCASFAHLDEAGSPYSYLFGNHPDDGVEERLYKALKDESLKKITHAGGYDYLVVMASYPDLIPVVFDALESGACTDTIVREKLLNLSRTGNLENYRTPDGRDVHIGYSLADFGKQYLGKDRTEEKAEQDGWRLNFDTLDGIKAVDYPEDAAEYAKEDAVDTLLVYLAQDEVLAQDPHLSVATAEFQLYSSVALRFMTAWGMKVNKAAVRDMRTRVYKILQANEKGLTKAGILQPSRPAVPKKTQLKRALDLIKAKDRSQPLAIQWEQFAEKLSRDKIYLCKPKPAKINQKPLQEHAAKVFKKLGKLPDMTAGGVREPKIKLDGEVIDMLALHDSVFAEYANRQHLSKLSTGQIPVLESGDVIHFNYNELVETGRTSSYGSRKGKTALYPSTNGQNVPKEIEGIDPRAAYMPRPGTVFFDVDGSGLELACVGQTTYDLFGTSVHLTRYNAKVDLHAYLGSSLVYQFCNDGIGKEFIQGCRTEGLLSDPMDLYQAFSDCKKHKSEEVVAFYKHWRDFAKPTGLGFPGGLGPATMVEFARTTYGVVMTEEEAYEGREVWRKTYPEMPPYFKWVEAQVDEYNSGSETLYEYTTPLGMVRRGATFCSLANGKAMQSPGAEGMKLSVIRVVRECYDHTLGSVLFGCRPIAFVHDQIIGETTRDKKLWHAQCMRVSEIICETMKLVLPDIDFRCDEAHLTEVWSKKSKPTFDKKGLLIPWRLSA
jgi:hypothetical protein